MRARCATVRIYKRTRSRTAAVRSMIIKTISHEMSIDFVLAEDGSLWHHECESRTCRFALTSGEQALQAVRANPFDGSSPALRIVHGAGASKNLYCVTEDGKTHDFNCMKYRWNMSFIDIVDPGFFAVMVACGTSHVLVLSDHGKVLIRGPPSFDHFVPAVFVSQDGLTEAPPAVHMVAAGDFHCVLAAADGRVWASGKNTGGQCSTVRESQDHFMCVQGDSSFVGSHVVFVAAGEEHTAAVTTDGTLWMWGDNSYNQLGLKRTLLEWTSERRVPPSRVVLLPAPAVMVVCAFSKTLAVTSDGALWAWGKPWSVMQDPRTALVRQIGDREAFGGARVVCASAGSETSMAMTEDGAVWVLDSFDLCPPDLQPLPPPSKVLARLGPGGFLRAGRYHATVIPEMAVLLAAVAHFSRPPAPARVMAVVMGIWQRLTRRGRVAAGARPDLSMELMRMVLEYADKSPPGVARRHAGLRALLGGGFAAA